MGKYLTYIEIDEEELDTVMKRIQKAQEEIYGCYNELKKMGVLQLKKDDTATAKQEKPKPPEVAEQANMSEDLMKSDSYEDMKELRNRLKKEIIAFLKEQNVTYLQGQQALEDAITSLEIASHAQKIQ